LAKVARQGEHSKGYTISVVPGISTGPAAALETNDQFAAFKSLAGKLVKVPKSEVDEKRQKA
jgi:hypothetical protein